MRASWRSWSISRLRRRGRRRPISPRSRCSGAARASISAPSPTGRPESRLPRRCGCVPPVSSRCRMSRCASSPASLRSTISSPGSTARPACVMRSSSPATAPNAGHCGAPVMPSTAACCAAAASAASASPAIPTAIRASAMRNSTARWRRKSRPRRRPGSSVEIVTQFCFDARAILDFVARLRAFGFDHRVRIGLAGPTNLAALIRYASRCGVQASAQALARRSGLDPANVCDDHARRSGAGARRCSSGRRLSALLFVRRPACERPLGTRRSPTAASRSRRKPDFACCRRARASAMSPIHPL